MTAPPPRNGRDRILAAFPELHAHGRPALLLHPRAGNPGVHDSSVGGPLLWPVEEPWPTCTQGHFAFGLPPEDGEVFFEEPLALQPVLQLFARDLPAGCSLPGSAELLQVLWCPNDHPDPPEAFGHHYGPSVVLRWRASTQVSAPLEEQPRPHTVVPEYRLPPCELNIEGTIDYPSVFELPEELSDLIDENGVEKGWGNAVPSDATAIPWNVYTDLMSPHGGMKVGGYGSWGLSSPFRMECVCGAELTHLL